MVALASNTTTAPSCGERTINAGEVQPQRFADRMQAGHLRRVEHPARRVQKCRFLLLHPGLIGHIGLDVMQLPIRADCEVVRKDRAAHEEETVLAKEPVRRAVIQVVDDVVILPRISRHEPQQLIRRGDLLELVAIVKPGAAHQAGQRRRRKICRQDSMALMADSPRRPATRDGGQQRRP